MGGGMCSYVDIIHAPACGGGRHHCQAILESAAAASQQEMIPPIVRAPDPGVTQQRTIHARANIY